MDELSWTIEGDPVPKGRPRHGRSGHSFTPKRTREAEQRIREYIADDSVIPFDVPVRVAIVFYCKTARRTDLDNLIKLVTDALIGTAYVDDHLIHALTARLHRKVLAETPRTEIRITILS